MATSKQTFKALFIMAAYNCTACKELQRVPQEGSKHLIAPKACPVCGGKSLDLNLIQSDFVDSETGELYGNVKPERVLCRSHT